MFITLINDSKDDNAKARQETRWASLFPNTHVSFVGIDSNLKDTATIEASGNLIDILDAGEGRKGIIAVNVAPRGQVKIDGINGSLFCYFYYKNTLVVSTIKGYNLSLIKKFGITKSVNVLETQDVLNFAEKNKLITKKQNKHISNTQFRSFDFQPRVAKWITDGFSVPSHTLSINKIPDIPPSAWSIDSFGNIKSTLIKNSLPLRGNPLKVSINGRQLHCKYYDHLKDIPDGETAIYTGSSGIGKTRFIEIATQNRKGSAAKHLNLKIGDKIQIV